MNTNEILEQLNLIEARIEKAKTLYCGGRDAWLDQAVETCSELATNIRDSEVERTAKLATFPYLLANAKLMPRQIANTISRTNTLSQSQSYSTYRAGQCAWNPDKHLMKWAVDKAASLIDSVASPLHVRPRQFRPLLGHRGRPPC